MQLATVAIAQPTGGDTEPPPTPTDTPADKTAGKPSEAAGIVFLGLRPLKGKRGPEDLPRLKEAQQIRATIESALAQASRKTVLGHGQMSARLGAPYLVKMFKCAGALPCLTNLAEPLTKDNVASVYAGDYYVDGGTYQFHIFRYSIATGALEQEINVAVADDKLESTELWKGALSGFFAAAIGRIQITVNETDTVCRVDGDACQFEADGKTLVLPLGEHEIEVSKDGFTSEKATVTVDAGAPKAIALSLTPTDPAAGELRVPPALGRRAPSLPVVRTESPPQIDGNLDDLQWKKAWVDPNFTQNFPDEAKAPTQRTEMRVLYDDNAIYVAIRCFDTEPNKIIARLTRRDRDVDSDKVAVDISSKNDRASAYHFSVSAAGVQVDGIRFGDTEFSTAWDGRWYSSVTRDSTGWTAEMKIPLVTLRYNGDVNEFGFQVRRTVARNGEIDEWSYVPRTARGEVSYYGVIRGMSGLNAKRLFEVLAYDSRRVTFRRNQGGVFDGTTTGSDIGADVKVGLTPALTLNGTINPDFGTVEVDQVILNLSTVEAYFPEKRPFFLEGADLFSTPFSLFYTRRVGATPPAARLTGEAEIAEVPAIGRIWGAANMSGLLGRRTSIALLTAVTARQDVEITRTPGGPREKLLVDPLANFSVLRLRKEFGTNSSIGLLSTAVTRLEPKGEAAPLPGDLCPVPYTTAFTVLIPPRPNKGRCTNDAYTGGVDAKVRSSDGEWGASGQVLGSFIVHGPKRQVPDGTVVGSGSKGTGVFFEAGRYGGKHWLYNVGYRHASPSLQINDAGFLSFANFHEFSGTVSWRNTKPVGPLLSSSVNFIFKHRRDWELKDNIYFQDELTTSLQFKNFWTLDAGGYLFPKYVEIRETRDGARTQRDAGYFAYVTLSTNPARRIVGSLSTYALKVKEGLNLWEVAGTLSLRPVPALELDLLGTYTESLDVQRWRGTTDNGDGTRTYLFNELDYAAMDLTMRGTYTFTRTLSLQAYVQTFLAKGNFRNPMEVLASGERPLLELDQFQESATAAGGGFRDGAVNVNLFIRWEYLPLSYLWLVYTRNQGQTGFDSMMEGSPRIRFDRFSNGPSTDVLLAKLTYLWY